MNNTNDKRALLCYQLSAQFLGNFAIPTTSSLMSPRHVHTRTSSMSKSKSPLAIAFKSPNKFINQQKKPNKIIKIERNHKKYSKETLQTQDSDQQVQALHKETEKQDVKNGKDSNQQSFNDLTTNHTSQQEGYKSVENEGLIKKFQELSNRFTNQKNVQTKQIQDIEKILSKEEDDLYHQLSKIDEKIKFIKEDNCHSARGVCKNQILYIFLKAFEDHQNYIAQIATLEEINFRLEQDNDKMKIIIREMSENIKKLSSNSNLNTTSKDDSENFAEILQEKDKKIEALSSTLYEYQKQIQELDKNENQKQLTISTSDTIEELKSLIEKLQGELWFSLQLCENQKNDLIERNDRIKELEKQLSQLQEPANINENNFESGKLKQKAIEQELEKAKQLLNQVMNIIFEIGGKKLIDQITSKLNYQ